MAAGLYDITNETLGKGHFAVVKLARHCLTGELVAVKIIDKMKLKKEGLQQLGLEIKLLSRLSEKEHPNIVKLYQVIDTKTKLYLVMEYPGKDVCDLYDYIHRKSSKGLREAEARHIFRQICSAIHYCHSLRIVHRDLKPENILIVNAPVDCESTTGDGIRYPVVKLIDFGFSNQWDEGEKLRTSCGSLAYSAPEILLGDYYDGDKVDIWGLGCILYILLYGYNPFMQINDSETLIKILDCSFTTPRKPSICDSSIHLIKSLLQRDPNSRLTIKQVLDHCWLKGTCEDYDDGNESEDGGGGSHHDCLHRELDEEGEEEEENEKEDRKISGDLVNKSNELRQSSPIIPVISSISSTTSIETAYSIHEKVIDHMISQGMCSSKDHVESALKKTRDRVNRTKSSELITSPVDGPFQVPIPINGEKLNEIKSSQDNYVTATYHLLKDKLVRELNSTQNSVNHNSTESTGSFESNQSTTSTTTSSTSKTVTKDKHHLKSRRGPRKPLVQQAPRLRPSFGSPLRDSSNDKCNNKIVQLEVSSSEDDASFVLPLARKCSIVSEEGSCAGTDISGNDGPNEPLIEIDPPLFENSRPSVNIIVTDYSESDAKPMEDCLEEGEDEIDSLSRDKKDEPSSSQLDESIEDLTATIEELKTDEEGKNGESQGNKVKTKHCDKERKIRGAENENEHENADGISDINEECQSKKQETDQQEQTSCSRILLRTSSSSNCPTNNPLHLVSSSPELLRDDDYSELYHGQKSLAKVEITSSPHCNYGPSHRLKTPLTSANTVVVGSPAMILNDGRGSSKNDIGDHVINHLAYTNSKSSTTNGSSSTATSLRIIVQSKSCNNILLGEEDKSALPYSPSSSSSISKPRKGLTNNYRVSSLLKRNKSDKVDCCSIC